MSMPIERPKSSRSLTATLAAAFLTLSVTILLVASGFQMYFSIQTQRQIVAGRQQLIAQDAANTVANYVQEKFGMLEATVELGGLASASQEEQEDALLWSLLRLDPAFRRLVLLDSQLQVLTEASRLSQAALGDLLDRAGSDLFSQVRAGNRYVRSVYVDPTTPEPMVILAVPVTDVSDDFQGALLAEVNLRFMWSLIGGLRVGEEGVAYVVDRQGNLIASRDIWRVLSHENLNHLREVGEFVSSSAPFDENGANISRGINGATVVGTYVPLEMPDWAVVTELPVTEAYREVVRNVVISASVVLTMATLAGLLGVYVARRLAVPLLALTETATRIAGGEMDLQATMAGPTEVLSLAGAFNNMTAQLRELIGSLEQRVADRTRNLQTAAEVARATASVLDPEELLRQTVDLVRERFDLYYVGVFLLDEAQRFAVLQAGTGEAGRMMLEQGHKLEVGGGSMVGQCVATGQARIALDVGAEAVRFDNPLLPKTRSEMALPLRSRGRVIGAMTVQSTEEAAFDEADIAVMQTMADQVAVALDNARLFAESQAALEAERRAYGELSLQAWNELLRTRIRWGYRYANRAIAPVAGDWQPEMLQAAQTGRSILSDGTRDSTLAVPIKMRDQVIGVLNLRKSGGGGAWSDDEIALLETLSEQLGVALESARLYQDTQRRAARERLIGEVTDRMRRAADMDTLLQTAIREMAAVLGAPNAFVQLAAPPEPVEDDDGDERLSDLRE